MQTTLVVAEKYVYLLGLVFKVSIFCLKYLWLFGFLVLLVMPPISILGLAKFIQPNEKQ
jgi:hypothetical protein